MHKTDMLAATSIPPPSRRVAACRDRVGDTISLIINYKCFCHPVAACRDPTSGWIEKMIFMLNLVTLWHAATLREDG